MRSDGRLNEVQEVMAQLDPINPGQIRTKAKFLFLDFTQNNIGMRTKSIMV